ncbi:MAG: hypothetical protein LBM64_08375 [Deltaproteobacteria bacterium]|nr:hypothetical protein [Deltaproteobacteria bacterium]
MRTPLGSASSLATSKVMILKLPLTFVLPFANEKGGQKKVRSGIGAVY